MLGLTINNVKIAAKTNKGVFSVNIPLSSGLNVIRAENSSGKSTCVNAIAYGLGLEAILGPKSKRPFPKSLYEVIFDSKDDETPYFVSSSYVQITATNSKKETVTTTREILGKEHKVTVSQDDASTDYFLGSAGNVGSAKSERGFHRWLAGFIGWSLPNVVTYEGNEVKLYIESIFPLFFIEQKRGWSEIQANIPTSYGIKNVKKSAIEFCLGIDSFEYEKKLTRFKNSIESSENEWQQLANAAEGIADFNYVILNRIPSIKDYKDAYDIEFMYQVGDTNYSIAEKQRSLKSQIDKLSQDIEAARPDTAKLNSQQAILRKLRRESEKNASEIEMVTLSISDVDGKITSLKNELDKYQQLRRLKMVGSSIEADLETETCPICESDLYDTLGSRNVKREPMTLEENIEFLKNQTDFYVNIKVRSIESLKNLQSQSKLLGARIEKEEATLNNLREDIDDINGATKSLLRDKIQTDIELKETKKLNASLNNLKEQASRIHASWSSATESLKTLRGTSRNADRGLVIRELLALIKDNLMAFNFSPASISSITVSHQTLRPEQEGYDIVAETSASDYIRIIWSYTLALLQLAGKTEDVMHGGFVVFDEPRQHEASYVSFANLIAKAAEASEYNGQVIFATSLKQNDLEEACKGNSVNLQCFDDYILRLQMA
ncbi:hypothetical protein [uncultured Zhongshania sp.]|uniref:AAA family ATPase n=1 Tax=uncultured Zhongshania sp. TaxID=1642288 RepID=UPI0025DF5974|nr:hypothetical protein [uncultured Zhongshania sp.]